MVTLIILTLLTMFSFYLFLSNGKEEAVIKAQSQVEAKGVVLKFWTKNTKIITGMLVLVLTLLKFSDVKADAIATDLGKLVLSIDMVVEAGLAAWLLLKGIGKALGITAVMALFICMNVNAQNIIVKNHKGQVFEVNKAEYDDIIGLADDYARMNEVSTKAFKPFDIIKDFLLNNIGKVVVMNDQKKAICNYGAKAINQEIDVQIFQPMFK